MLKKLGLTAAAIMAALPALAQTATDAAAPVVEAVAEAAAPVMDKGDVSWMMTSTVLVLFMTIPGLALFYGGLVRSKNMLSILMQTTLIACLVMVLWVLYGYSVTFGGGTSPYWGGFGKVFLAGVTPESMSATFSAGYVIPEYLFIAFQMTFAAITPGLIIGAFAERVKFTAVLAFCALWVTFVYFPIAHMVWDVSGLIFVMGAIDFAGGTVVHINAGIAALVGCLVIGKRVGYGKENMAPHSMVMTMIGASMLWVGWFGFNVGSNLGSQRRRDAGDDQHLPSNRCGNAGLVAAGRHPARQSLDAGCGFGHGGGSGCDHPGLWHGWPDGRDCALGVHRGVRPATSSSPW